MQDHLLVGQPGTALVQAAICSRCGDTLAGLVRLCGSEISLLVQSHQLPASATRGDVPADSDLDHTRERLVEHADSLSRTERALRDEAQRMKPSPTSD